MRRTKFNASDFPNYSISEDGEIRNSKGKIIKGEISNNGYRRVSLSNNDVKHKKMSVHRLVAETFLINDDPANKTQVNHINEIKTDNRECNLQYITPKENINYGKTKKESFNNSLCR